MEIFRCNNKRKLFLFKNTRLTNLESKVLRWVVYKERSYEHYRVVLTKIIIILPTIIALRLVTTLSQSHRVKKCLQEQKIQQDHRISNLPIIN